MQIISRQHDTVDLICHRFYGYTAGVTEQVLNLNPGLAAHEPRLPVGITITLPEHPVRPFADRIQLWD